MTFTPMETALLSVVVGAVAFIGGFIYGHRRQATQILLLLDGVSKRLADEPIDDKETRH